MRLPAVKQCAVPRAVKQSSLPQGHRQGGDGAQAGDTVKGFLRCVCKHMACANHCLQSSAMEANYACWLIVFNGPLLVPAPAL